MVYLGSLGIEIEKPTIDFQDLGEVDDIISFTRNSVINNPDLILGDETDSIEDELDFLEENGIKLKSYSLILTAGDARKFISYYAKGISEIDKTFNKGLNETIYLGDIARLLELEKKLTRDTNFSSSLDTILSENSDIVHTIGGLYSVFLKNRCWKDVNSMVEKRLNEYFHMMDFAEGAIEDNTELAYAYIQGIHDKFNRQKFLVTPYLN